MENLLMGKKLLDRTVGFLQKSLDIRTARQKILSGNIANTATPDYGSKDLPFQKILERSAENASTIHLQKTHPAHFPEPEGYALTTDFSSEIETGSAAEGVNIEKEMARLAENNLMFQASVQALVKKLEALKVTIAEGR